MKVTQIEVPSEGTLALHQQLGFITADGDMYVAASMFMSDDEPIIVPDMPIIVKDGYAYVSLRHLCDRYSDPDLQEMVDRAFASDVYLAAMASLDTSQESNDGNTDAAEDSADD